MRLIPGDQWIRETFESATAPSIRDVVSWIERAEIPGKVIAGQPWVDAERFALGTPVPGRRRIDGGRPPCLVRRSRDTSAA